jgi:hypothetical protein
MNYGQIGQNNNPVGFTNNWNTERSRENLFSHRYTDYTNITNQTDSSHTSAEILTSTTERNPVSDMFFSERNINHLKVLLAKMLREKNGYNITPESQSNNDLIVVMRGVYLSHSKNLPVGIPEQVIELNYITITDIYPRMVSNIKHYLSYIRESGSQPLPLEVPQYISRAGTKTNRSITDIFL